MNESEHQPHHPNVRLYLIIFGALMLLTVVTVLASYLQLPPLLAVTVGMAIATIKAGLVAAFFMHLKGERVLIYGLLGLTIFFMAILFWGSIYDSTLTAERRLAGPSLTAAEEGAGVP